MTRMTKRPSEVGEGPVAAKLLPCHQQHLPPFGNGHTAYTTVHRQAASWVSDTSRPRTVIYPLGCILKYEFMLGAEPFG